MRLLDLEKLNQSLQLEDSIIYCIPYNSKCSICDKMSIEKLHLILPNVNNEVELVEYLQKFPSVISCWTVHMRHNDEPLGFFLIEDCVENVPTVKLHGGGWAKNLLLTPLYFRTGILLIKALLNRGIKVRTQVDEENTRSQRFVKGLGFVKYRKYGRDIQMWISYKRIYKNKYYKKYITN